MKVRTKLALLLLGVIATFVTGLIAVKSYDRARFREVAAARDQERRRSFDTFVERWSDPLKVLTTYFSCMDGLVEVAAGGSAGWAEANFRDDTLASYRACSAWLYNAAGERVFGRNIMYSEQLADPPVPASAIKSLLDRRKVAHFFAQTPLGLMEFQGATVHPSRDAGRTSPPRGYLLAGRLWSNEDLHEIKLFTGNEIQLAAPGEEPIPNSQQSLVTFTRPLPGWDGTPVGTLLVRNESHAVEMLNRSSERLFYALLGFAVILFLLLVVSLNQWVSQPLKSLSKCLREHNVECLKPLERVQDEFNEVARLIRAFFEQRATLIREMSERVQTQAALQESEERLRHSQKMEAVGRLAGGVAHDFNNLLTAIIGYAELIAERSGDGTTREEARLIGKAGEQAAGLTRQLLAFSRKQILQPRVIDLNALVGDMQRLLRRIIGEHIDLRVETNATESRVLADPTQLEQVILNLGVNARDAMPRGGVLTMRTVNALVTTGSDRDGTQLPPGRYVALIVQDTGCGMDIETKERVFEPFFTTKGPGKGTGLGLATVYGIVRQSGGTILVDSKPGEGTTFTIQLPQAEAPVEDLQLATAGEARSRDSETVLVVEDEDIVRELVCTVLSEQGYQVLCAANGAEGLRLADEHPGKIDLLVTDVIMPGMSGPEVAAQLRESRPETRVLFVSGYSDGDITDQGVLAPQLRFLEKPFTPDALGMKVREVLDEAAPV